MLLVHRRHVVEPVEIGQVLQVGAALHQLLGAAVQEPDMRVAALDDLAVEFEHQPQHAVRRRMLRPEIDVEVPDLLLARQDDQVPPSIASNPPARFGASRIASSQRSTTSPMPVTLTSDHSGL